MSRLNLTLKSLSQWESKPFLLRVYLRDQEAGFREKKLAEMLEGVVPIPKVCFLGEQNGRSFLIVEYKEGITLRDLLLSGNCQNLEEVMAQVAEILIKIHKIHFPQAGFFDQDLSISKKVSKGDYFNFGKECSSHPAIRQVLQHETIERIGDLLDQYKEDFPDEQERSLVHGDFGPENILVHECDGKWKILTVLDWEFAHSGSPLMDLANMLRYAHKMPEAFASSFLGGLEAGGMHFPKNWQKEKLASLRRKVQSKITCKNFSNESQERWKHPKLSPIFAQ